MRVKTVIMVVLIITNSIAAKSQTTDAKFNQFWKYVSSSFKFQTMPDLGRSILFSTSHELYPKYSQAIEKIEGIYANPKLQDFFMLEMYKKLGAGEYGKLMFANLFGCSQSMANYMVDYIEKKYKKDKRYVSWKIDQLVEKAKEEDSPKFDTIEETKVIDTTKQSLEFITVSSAEFETGVSGWKRYLSIGLNKWGYKYIDSLKNLNIRIEVEFLITQNGSVDSVSTKNEIGKDLIDKITKLLLNSPKWQPATQNDKPVAERKREIFRFSKELDE